MLDAFDFIQLHTGILDSLPVAVIIVDSQTFNIIYVNDGAKKIIESIKHIFDFDLDVNNLIGLSVDVFHKNPAYQRRILSDAKNLPHYARVHIGDQTLDLKVSAVMDPAGRYLASMLTLENVTAEIVSNQKLYHMAHYDVLTDLPNRVLFFKKLSEFMDGVVKKCSVIYIDLDGFGIINDTYGHQVGDRVIGEFADRLKAIEVEEEQYVMFSRIGGDEFLCLFSENSVEEVSALSDRIISVFDAPFDVGGQKMWLNASIGIALMPEHGILADILIGHADLALSEAKRAGKGRVCFFSEDLVTQAWEQVRISKKLRSALINEEELFLFFQPIVELKTGRVVSRETLVRWNNPLRGWVSPAEFIPIAEQSDLIELLDDFVLEKACLAALSWQDGARVAVNISARHLGRNTLVPKVAFILRKTSLPPDRLEIEVTETAELHLLDRVMEDLHALRRMGVHITLDDFGTGFSSLSQIRFFPFGKIKIDSSFVRDAMERPECAAVIGAIASIGQRLGLRVVAEGVETQAQHDLVTAEGCSEGQGYFYGAPSADGRYGAPCLSGGLG